MSNKKKLKNKKKNGGRVTSVSAWKGKDAALPLELPSGNTCLVKAPGMQVFLQRGFIPNSLLPFVTTALDKGKAPDVNKLKETIADPESLDEMIGMMDAVVCYCVIEPPVSPVPRDEEGNLVPLSGRDEDVLWADEVDLNDKTFIFQFAVGGTRDLESFRQGLAQSMVSLPAGEAVLDTTESTPGDPG